MSYASVADAELDDNDELVLLVSLSDSLSRAELAVCVSFWPLGGMQWFCKEAA